MSDSLPEQWRLEYGNKLIAIFELKFCKISYST